MSGAEVTIRVARLEDARAIAELHVAVWREAYRDLAPPEVMVALDVSKRLPRWVEMIARAERSVLVGERDGRIVGIGTAGAATVPELGGHGEILYLYVDSTYARAGIGRALMRHLAQALQAQGYDRVALGVVEGNQSAIDFYLKLGGRLAGSYIDPGPLWRSRNQIIIWDDVQVLLSNGNIRRSE
ncbi:GNAT family N-acetyltransferase [Dongia sp.]|uniref:GNAT family N-acetyltransferase n=1 Tax=Dongia sp. TaxID=1977262 RepID=UPI00374FE4E4